MGHHLRTIWWKYTSCKVFLIILRSKLKAGLSRTACGMVWACVSVQMVATRRWRLGTQILNHVKHFLFLHVPVASVCFTLNFQVNEAGLLLHIRWNMFRSHLKSVSKSYSDYIFHQTQMIFLVLIVFCFPDRTLEWQKNLQQKHWS